MKHHEARDLYLDGVEAARRGRRVAAEHLLRASLALDAQNFQAWLWLAGVVDSPEESIRYLERVLQLFPNEPHALEGILWAKRRIHERNAEVAAAPEQELFTADSAATKVGDTPSPVPAAPPGRNRRLRWLWGAVLVLGLCLICASLVYLIDEAGLLSQIRQGGVGSSSGAGVPPATTMVPARTPQASPSVERSYSSDLAVPLTPGGNLTPTLALTRESEASETLTPSPR